MYSTGVSIIAKAMDKLKESNTNEGPKALPVAPLSKENEAPAKEPDLECSLCHSLVPLTWLTAKGPKGYVCEYCLQKGSHTCQIGPYQSSPNCHPLY